jgi:catechol 2,3-dioxygenase-like lactoylglutathione lyase family enzyme
LEHWTLLSSDVARTKHFYVDVLGATFLRDAGGSTGGAPTSVDLAGTIIDFFQAGGDRAPQPGSGGQHHAYIIKLEDYDPWVQHFEKHNVEMRRTTHGMGRISIYIDDPDGYHIEFTHPFEGNEDAHQEIEKRGLMPEAMRGRG